MGKLDASLQRGEHPRKDTVLLMTGGFLHQGWTDMDLEGFLGTWQEVASIARARPETRFIIKPHPSVRDLGSWYRRFGDTANVPNLTVVDDQKLESLLPSAFLAVLIGKPGTAGLVSALAGVPFVYCDSMLCRDVPGYRIWRDENGVPRLATAKDLAPLLDRVRLDPDERHALLEQNRRFSLRYLQPFRPAALCAELGLSA